MNHLTDVLKYADLFGTHFNFYTDKKRKFYTSLGGILTLLSFVISLLVFILINYDELLHNNPISTTSYSKEPYRNVRFLEEKIWIPWRIRDYRARTFNFTGVFYPIAFYYHATRNFSKDALDLEFKVLDLNYGKIWYKDFFGTSNLFLPILSVPKKIISVPKKFFNFYKINIMEMLKIFI